MTEALTRRGFLAVAGGAAAVFPTPRALRASTVPLPGEPFFTLGVASGDPLPRGVVL